jgi:hypothetical protein
MRPELLEAYMTRASSKGRPCHFNYMNFHAMLEWNKRNLDVFCIIIVLGNWIYYEYTFRAGIQFIINMALGWKMVL